MNFPTIQELIEQTRNQIALENEADQREHEWKVSPKDLVFAGAKIKHWKTLYFRKNSKHPASIYCRWSTIPLANGLYNVFNLQLFVKGALEEEWILCKEAFDVLVNDIIPSSNSSCDIYTLHQIEGTKKKL